MINDSSVPSTWGRHIGGVALLITSALNGGEWSTSHPSCFLTGKDSSAHWKGGWVGPRACLDNIKKRKILTLPEVEPWIIQPVALSLNWLLYLSFTKQQLLDKTGALYYACLLSRPVVRFIRPIWDLGSGARELHVVFSQSSRCNLSHFERAWELEDVTQVFRTL